MLTTAEAADRLGLSVARVKVLAAEGRIPGAVKVGRQWVFPAEPRIEGLKPHGRPPLRQQSAGA